EGAGDPGRGPLPIHGGFQSGTHGRDQCVASDQGNFTSRADDSCAAESGSCSADPSVAACATGGGSDGSASTGSRANGTAADAPGLRRATAASACTGSRSAVRGAEMGDPSGTGGRRIIGSRRSSEVRSRGDRQRKKEGRAQKRRSLQ